MMSFLSPDSVWRGGDGVNLVFFSTQSFLSLEGNVAMFQVDLGKRILLHHLSVFPYTS